MKRRDVLRSLSLVGGASLLASAARFVRITQTANVPDAPPFAVQRLRLYEAPAATPGR
ncbi:MAG: hypothetical protein ABI051_10885 [Vicinamibacterales bacterium]